METHSKLILNVAVGRRDQGTTNRLHRRFANGDFGPGFQITTDGFVPYRSAISGTLEDRVDFAQLIKLLAHSRATLVRHPHATIPDMADSACVPSSASAFPADSDIPRHTAAVRFTHWITVLCFFALLVSGLEIVMSHPRFYWGETGNVLTTPLFKLPIPSSRDTVPTGYGYVLPDQNGWSRALHFQAAWRPFTAAVYLVAGLFARHFTKNLFPAKADFSPRALAGVVVNHLRFSRPEEAGSMVV